MKKIKVSLAATAAVLAMAGLAQAAPAELNIFGASAQYDYWNAQAEDFAANVLGCTNVTGAVIDTSKKHGLVVAKNCNAALVPEINSVTGTHDIDIRYSGIASAEGPLAASKQDPVDPALATGCDKTKGERLMYLTSTTKICKPVHVGTSDVAGESLVQMSSGTKLGPMGGTLMNIAMPGVDTSTLNSANTVVVPFGFFANEAVKARKCTAGYVGAYCTSDANCYNGAAGTCSTTSTTIDNISREEATIIFSGILTNWKELGDYFDDVSLVACLRHAGSGTHSALDLTVMNSGWGSATATDASYNPEHVYFNQGSSDEMKCINGATEANPAGSNLVGAIGYADADQKIAVAGASDYVKQLKYNGHYPTRSAIRNGLYDFYTNAWLYTSKTADAATKNRTDALIAYAQQSANVPSTKANFWASVGEMKFNRLSDVNYPVQQFPGDIVLP